MTEQRASTCNEEQIIELFVLAAMLLDPVAALEGPHSDPAIALHPLLWQLLHLWEGERGPAAASLPMRWCA